MYIFTDMGPRNLVRPEVGHLVLIREKGLPRGMWKSARVIKLDTSNDGENRSAMVRLASGLELHRPVGLLIPFEFQSVNTGVLDQTERKPRNQRSSTPPRKLQATHAKVVYAKFRGWPKWPAKILEDITGTPLDGLRNPPFSIPVQFFKTEKYAFVPKGKISPFANPQQPTGNQRLNQAIQMAEVYIGKEENKIGPDNRVG